MTQQGFVLANWIGRLTARLDDLVKYEKSVEFTLSDLRWRGELMLGLSGNTHSDPMVSIRERIGWYSMLLGRRPHHDSDYQQNVAERLDSIVRVLLKHPILGQAIHTSDDQLVFGIDLAVERMQRQPVIYMVMGLVDHAVQHTPLVAAEALARMIECGKKQNLFFYSIMLFRGLHVESKHDIAQNLSVISWQEARQYMPDTIAYSLLGRNNSIGGEPIAAVVSPTKWGPAIVPAEYDLEGSWPTRSPSFRNDALLLIDLMAVTHVSAVISEGVTYQDVEQEIRRLVGRSPFFRVPRGDFRDELPNVAVPVTPEMSTEGFSEAAKLFAEVRNDQGKLRLALSRLASSLSRSGPQAALDSIIDVAIALEAMYQVGPPEQTYRLATRASYFLEESPEGRTATYESVKEFYKTRSSIVHGGTGDEADVLDAGFDIARRTLSKLILEGGPSNFSDWDELVIGGGVE